MKAKVIKKEIILVLISLLFGLFFSLQSNAQCQAGFTFVVNNDSVHFTSTSTGYSLPMYTWNFGDGTYSASANPVHHYSYTGFITVRLTVTDSTNWCSSIFIDTVQINSVPCHAGFTANTNNGLTVSFLNQSWGPPIANFWDFGDGTTSNLSTQTHSYTTPGSYLVCLTNYTINDTCTYCDTVVVSACHAMFYYHNTTAQNISFVNQTTANPNPGGWHWDFGDGTYSTQQSPAHQFINPGNHTVCLTAYSSTGDSCSYCQTICVCNSCQANFTYTLIGNTVTFTNTSSCISGNPPLFTWMFGDGTSSHLTNPTHTFSNGVFLVRLYTWDTAAVTFCPSQICDTSATVYYQNIPINGCSNSFTYTNSAQNTATFQEQTIGTVTGRYWSFGDGTTSSAQDPVHTYPASGTYYTCLDNYTASDTCSHCDSVRIGCVAHFHWGEDTLNHYISFYDYSYANPIGNHWDFGDGTSGSGQNAHHVYTSSGTFYVCLTSYTQYDTCVSCDSVYVSCDAYFNVYPSPGIPHQYYVVSTVVGAPPVQYLWSWGDGTFDNIQFPSHTYAVAGFYNICLTITDNNACTKTHCYAGHLSKDTNSMIYIQVIDSSSIGIREYQNNPSFKAYPNPANNTLNVQLLQDNSTAEIKIYNLLGQIQQTLKLTTKETAINISALSKGAYIIEVATEKNVGRGKFVKE